jgi:hypothetical protein
MSSATGLVVKKIGNSTATEAQVVVRYVRSIALSKEWFLLCPPAQNMLACVRRLHLRHGEHFQRA